MDALFEPRVMHNPALGAILQWRCAARYFDETSGVRGPDLPFLLLLLPLVLHRKTTLVVRRMQFGSGLLKAVADEPMLRVGLQRRLETFAKLSLTSLNLACASKLLILQSTRPWPRLLPESKPHLASHLIADTEDVGDMMKAAERFGSWFAQSDLVTTATLLGVRF